MKTMGIYKITCLINNKIYIGSSINIRKRWTLHRNKLDKNEHHSNILQRAWLKYGKANFKFEIIENINNKSKLIKREQYYLDTLLFAKDFIKSNDSRFFKLGYNINPTAGSQLGRIVSKETGHKISKALEGQGNPMYGKYGKDNPNFGSKRSDETKKNMSLSKSGKNHPAYGKYGKDNPMSKRIIQKNLNGDIIKLWNSGADINRELGYSNGNISSCCKTKLKSGGLKVYKDCTWHFEKDVDPT